MTSFEEKRKKYEELRRQGVPAREAAQQAFPNGVERAQAESLAEEQSSSATGQIAGYTGGALTSALVADLARNGLTNSTIGGWLGYGAKEGGALVAPELLKASYISGAAPTSASVAAPTVSTVAAPTATGAGAGTAGATSGGAGSTAGLGAGAYAGLGALLFALLAPKHGEKYVGKPVMSAGGKITSALGLGDAGERARPVSDESFATSTMFENQIPELANLSPEQRAQFLMAAREGGLTKGGMSNSGDQDYTKLSAMLNDYNSQAVTSGTHWGQYAAPQLAAEAMFDYGGRGNLYNGGNRREGGSNLANILSKYGVQMKFQDYRGQMVPDGHAMWSSLPLEERLRINRAEQAAGTGMHANAESVLGGYEQLMHGIELNSFANGNNKGNEMNNPQIQNLALQTGQLTPEQMQGIGLPQMTQIPNGQESGWNIPSVSGALQQQDPYAYQPQPMTRPLYQTQEYTDLRHQGVPAREASAVFQPQPQVGWQQPQPQQQVPAPQVGWAPAQDPREQQLAMALMGR